MNYEEKAKELVDKFRDEIMNHAPLDVTRSDDLSALEELDNSAKKCALVAVDEILSNEKLDFNEHEAIVTNLNYWQKVKEAIEVL